MGDETTREPRPEPIDVRTATAEDAAGCVDVLASLPDYFTPSTHDDVRASVAAGASLTVVGERDGAIVAFVQAELRYPKAAEITYAAVRPELHGRGIGTTLLDVALAELARRRVAVVEAKTLDASSGYEPYVATQGFWEARGFVQIDCIDPLPGWDAGNPSAIYVKALSTTWRRPRSMALMAGR